MAIYGSVVAELLGISLDHDAMPVSSTPLIPLRQSLRLKENAAWFALASDCLISYHIYIHIYIYISGWWFGTFFIFPYIGNNNPNGLVFQTEGLKPTTRYMISIPLLELQAKTGILKPTKLGRWPNSLRREDKPWIFYGRGEVKAVPSGIHIYIYTYKIISKFRSSWNHD